MRAEALPLPPGAHARQGGVTHFRVWAPAAQKVDVLLGADSGVAVALHACGQGYFAGDAQAPAGTLYRFRLDGEGAFPDPASRYQPQGPHGPSEVIDPSAFAWSDAAWQACGPRGQVLYEMHVGTFTPEGTYAAAMEHLPYLQDLGITTIELMPVNGFDGRFGWGYDGVNLFAPSHLYGRPDDLRSFVDKAHALGLGVILDVVYNHLGPSGNYLGRFSPDYVTSQYATEWGEAINFDGQHSAPVRELFIANAAYWIREFHMDGLRLDATQCIYDAGPRHVLDEITAAARHAAGARTIFIAAENEPQHAHLARPPERGGFGVDALWNDDLHHSFTAAATGLADAYYSETRGTPQELISGIKWGYLYQGQYYAWQKQRRGRPALDLPATAFVGFLQNHDQIANSARGQRLHELTSPGRMRALTALLLLSPATPMLFQGQEFASSSPFLFFAGYEGELANNVREGRAEFLRQFPNLSAGDDHLLLVDPAAEATFERSKLRHEERVRNAHVLAMHRELLRLRREDPVFSAQDATR
ncbi:MAG: malto-oligosyltrehalose trehalohydrolase, partial [Alcaligenaceae bacterium]